MEKMFYSMKEVSELLNVPQDTIRYWCKNFPDYIKPERNAKGNRMFKPSDLKALKDVQYLHKEKGLSIKGTMKELSTRNIDEEQKKEKIKNSLEQIKRQLLEIKQLL